MAEMEDFEFGSVCSGIEAASVAFGPLGWRAAWLSEIEPFPSAVLQHHYPSVPNLGDMTRVAAMVRARSIKAPNMLCGGTPCQSFSLAGLRKSLDDARGNLALEFIRIADAIDDIRRADGKPPAYVLWENVPGVLNTKDNAFGSFLGGLCGSDAALHPDNDGWPSAGVVAGPRRVVAWRVLDAQHFGVAQRRRRVYVLALAGPGGWRCADALLSIRHSLSGHPAPRREAGQEPAFTLAGGARKRGGFSYDDIPAVAGALPAGHGPNGHGGSGLANLQGAESGHILAFGGNRTSGPIDVAPALLAQPGSGYKNDFESETFLLGPTHTLRGEGFDASEDGTGRGTPLVPVLPFDTTQVTSATNRSNPKPGDPCHALPAQGHAPVIAFQTRGSNLDVGSISGTLGVNSGSASGCAPMIAFSAKDHGADAAHELAPTLRAGGHTRSHANAGVMPAIAYQLEGEGHGRMDGGTPQGSDDLSTWAMRTVRGIGCGSSSQERGLEGPLADEPAAPLPQLPHEGSSLGRALPSVRQAAQGAGVLRHALSEVQEVGRPDQTRRPRKSDLQPAGLRTAGAQQWAVQQACPAVKTGHTGAASEDQERSRAKPMAVRRLTPVECERLMGFPDGYTDVPWRGKRATDGPRYKALGNSWAVPTVQWIGRRIEMVDAIAHSKGMANA